MIAYAVYRPGRAGEVDVDLSKRQLIFSNSNKITGKIASMMLGLGH